MPDKISILKESGETINSNVVSVFMIPDTEKKYIITTENAVDPHGLTVLHVSEMADGSLRKIATDEEWSSIKTIMRAMISGNVSSYQYLPTVESINASGQYSRDISVSASASKQMIDNYVAGEKSNVVAAPMNPSVPGAPVSGVPVPGAPAGNVGMNPMPPGAPNVPPAIFPTNGGNAVSSDDELIPGISEVDAVPVDPSVLQNGMLGNSGMMPQNPIPGMPPMNNNSMMQPQNPMGQNMMNNQMNPMNNPIGQPSTMTPVTGMVNPVSPFQPGVVPPANMNDNNIAVPGVVSPVMPVLPDNNLSNGMSNEVQVPNIPGMPPLTDSVNTMTASNTQVNNTVLGNVPSLIPETDAVIPEMQTVQDTPLTPNVQVLQPSVSVPTGQIAQDAQPSEPAPEVKIDTNVASSFDPNASLDSVVVAAQEMFMEGVKNLVQTIQEKVYRDLYAREAQIKEKEATLEQREKMLNEQMMSMMTNFAAMQGKPMVPPTLGQPTLTGNVNEIK